MVAKYLGADERSGCTLTAEDPRADLAGTGFDGGPFIAVGAVALVLGISLLMGESLQRADD